MDRPPQPQNKATMTTAAGVAGGSISSSSVSTARRKPQQQATIHHKYNKGRNYHHSSSNANSNDNSNNNNYNSDVDYSTATSSVTTKGGKDRGRGGGFISRLGLGGFRSLSRGNSNHGGDHTDTTATLNPILDGLGAEGEDDSNGHHAPMPSPLRRKVKPVPSPTMR